MNSWGCFLYARARCIHEMLAEGRSEEDIAETLSMTTVRSWETVLDADQVRLIGATPLDGIAIHCDFRREAPEAGDAPLCRHEPCREAGMCTKPICDGIK